MTATRRPGRPWRPGRVLLGWAVAATAAMAAVAAMVTAGSNCFVASRVTQERQERSIPPAAAKESEGPGMSGVMSVWFTMINSFHPNIKRPLPPPKK